MAAEYNSACVNTLCRPVRLETPRHLSEDSVPFFLINLRGCLVAISKYWKLISKLNWTRGLFRVWALGSLMWLILVGAMLVDGEFSFIEAIGYALAPVLCLLISVVIFFAFKWIVQGFEPQGKKAVDYRNLLRSVLRVVKMWGGKTMLFIFAICSVFIMVALVDRVVLPIFVFDVDAEDYKNGLSSPAIIIVGLLIGGLFRKVFLNKPIKKLLIALSIYVAAIICDLFLVRSGFPAVMVIMFFVTYPLIWFLSVFKKPIENK